MKKKRLLDSYALIAYLKKEDNYQRIANLLSSSLDAHSAVMNEINVGESYYIISRERGSAYANYFIETIMPNLPIHIISNSFDPIIEAARIKACHPISFADCFAVATAMREDAVIITGDPEFKKVAGMVDIEWLKK